MRIVERPSPNAGPRRTGPTDMLILHYTGMRTTAEALDRLCDPAAEVSAHYLVDEDGTVHRLVDEALRAWHAGRAFWAGERDVNSRSIGIELVNPGHEYGYRPFPPPQMTALAALAQGILARHPIPPARVLGHSDVAPTRKEDPGELFDWAWLAARGIGLWPQAAPAPLDLSGWQRALAAYGYEVGGTGILDAQTRAAITAFQRHFRPAQLTGEPDDDAAGLLLALVQAMPGA